MDKNSKLQELFENDPLGLLNVSFNNSSSKNSEERLIESFLEINNFFIENNRLPEAENGILEHQLQARLQSIQQNSEKLEFLKKYDNNNLLTKKINKPLTIEEIMEFDPLGLLNDDSEGIYDIKNIKTPEKDRAEADFIAKRKPCKSFDKYEPAFKRVHLELKEGKRKLIKFKHENLREDSYYIHNGILLYLKSVKFNKNLKTFKSGNRNRPDGRTLTIFENGTQSNMMFQSLYKALFSNGFVVTESNEKLNEDLIQNFNPISINDQQTGYIYIVQSKSTKNEIREVNNLYKIGFSANPVEERIKNAKNEPTYLMSDVEVISVFKCFNINPQKFEQLIQKFFGNTCLDIEIIDSQGNRHHPREWFIVPIEIIQTAIEHIISGEIVNYEYDYNSQKLIKK